MDSFSQSNSCNGTGLQGFQRFFDGRYAFCCLQKAVVPQAHHPLALGDAADLTAEERSKIIFRISSATTISS